MIGESGVGCRGRNPLGIRIRGGVLNIDPRLLQASEFTHNPRTFKTTNVDGKHESFELKSGSLAFTYCQTPFIYDISTDSSQVSIEIDYRDDDQEVSESNQLPADAYQDVIRRTGNIRSVRVTIREASYHTREHVCMHTACEQHWWHRGLGYEGVNRRT